MFDRALLTLSSGALAVSLAFLKDYPEGVVPGTRGWLLVAWLLLAGCMFSVLASFKVSQRALRTEMNHSDKPGGREGGRAATMTSWLNGFAFLAFAAGVVFLLLFAY